MRHTALHPNLIQYLGERLVQLLSPVMKQGTGLQVAASQIDEIGASNDYRTRFATTFWSQSTPLEKYLSTRLDWPNLQTAEQLRADVIERGKSISLSKIIQSLNFLELYAIAEQTIEGYSYASEVFNSYIRPYSQTGLVDEWIEEIE
jgi:hypothetical protein